MVLNPDYREFFQFLNENEVRYLVVGGYAVAFHGYPRYTKEIDVWIESTAANASRLLQALQDFGFGSLDLNEDDFLTPDQIIQLGYLPARIDLITSLAGVGFDECFASRLEVEISGLRINFIDRGNLIRNKRASGRLQGQADVEQIEHE